MGGSDSGAEKSGARVIRWFQGGSITQQVGRVFNLFALLVLLLGAIATVGALRIEQRSTTLADLTDVAFLTANMTRSVALSKDDMGAYRARGYDPELIARSIGHAKEAIAMNSDLKISSMSLGPDFVAEVAALDAGLRRIEAIMGEIRDAPRSIVEQESFLGPKYDEIDATMNQIVELREIAATRVEAYSGEGLYEIQLLIAVLAAGVAIALGLVLLGKRLVAKRIVSPIVAISDASEKITQGDTDQSIPGTARDDEIGKLASALTVLRQVQEESVEKAQREHQRELERERELQREREEQRKAYSDQLRNLADQFEKKIGDVASEVATASDQMHAAAVELSDRVEASTESVSQANDSLKQASSGITGAASASDEFALSISEVSRQASSSSERARKASDAARKADKTVTALTDSAAKISQIIEVIAGIAQRTNLLALNASIEAARGGEAGRGFAVVASEVKELAIQTSKATAEVEGLIHAMQQSTGESVSALELISDEVVELESTAMAIATAVDQQAVAGEDLARSIDVAARNTRAVSETVDDVNELSSIFDATASEVKEGSANLNAQATMLREQVATFLREVRAA